MILLITSSLHAQDCAQALTGALRERTQLATSMARAASLLQRHEYSALVLDECVMATPVQVESLLRHGNSALPIYVNFAISDIERVVREVRSALRRHEQERQEARRAATDLLRSELRGAVTGILLSSQLALSVPQLPQVAEEKLKTVFQLAERMRVRLGAEA